MRTVSEGNLDMNTGKVVVVTSLWCLVHSARHPFMIGAYMGSGFSYGFFGSHGFLVSIPVVLIMLAGTMWWKYREMTR